MIVDEDDIFGDGVNVASRLEGVAKPGGLAVSSAVRDNIGNKLDLVFEDMGDQELKNIEFPVRAYNVVDRRRPGRSRPRARRRSRQAVDRGAAVQQYERRSRSRNFSPTGSPRTSSPTCKVSGLFVVGRNTSFTYKGKRSSCSRSRANWVSNSSSKAASARPGNAWQRFGSTPS